MDKDNLDPIVGEDGAEVSTKETLGTGTVSLGETPPTKPNDEEKKLQQISQKYEDDISKLKSSFQRSEHELRQSLEKQRRDYDAQLREIKMSKMDEEERKKFEAEELVARNKNYEAEAEKAKRALSDQKQIAEYRKFFISVGVPVDNLDETDDLSTYVNQGYALLKLHQDNLKKELETLKKKQAKSEGDDEEIPAPDVDTSTRPPGKGTTWKDLIKQYGSEERVWSLIDRGLLSPSVLPKV